MKVIEGDSTHKNLVTDEVVDMADLKKKSIRGGMLTMASQSASIGIQLISTVVLARILSPEDYGVMAMVMAVTAFAGLFRDLGLSSAAIQKKDLTKAQQSNLFWLNVAMGLILTIIVASLSPLVVWFYGKPDLLWVTVTLSASFLIGSLGTQHGARLVRNMQFGRKAVATIIGALVTLVTSVLLALYEFSYWSLVWGNLAGALATTVLLFIMSPFRPGWYTRGAGIKSMLGFGANVTAFDLVNYFHRNLDKVLIGKFLGSEMLGLYSRAYQLLMLPITAIRNPINAVAFPAMSRLKEQPEDYKKYYRKITHLMALGSMPLTAFLFISAAPLIELTLGKEWSGVTPIFSLLAITGFIQPVAGLRGNVLLSCGHGQRYLLWGIFNAVCVCVGFLIGIRWGVIGIATSYAIVNYITLYPSLLFAFKNTPLSPRDFFGPILVPVFASIVAALVSQFLSTRGGVHELKPFAQLSLIGFVFATLYLITSAIFASGRASIMQLYRVLVQLKQRQA
ncbi:MAG: lipopolysaccharide biosynthesis protein [Patiriisocius sp.]|uniref:lipopolysaccharide biosynthesis protein n=1 Tax=Patiriisocius sp. TaxID=2822396 RepID=UPI003EF70F67